MIIYKLNTEFIDQSFIETISSFKPFNLSVDEAKILFQSLPENITVFVIKHWNKIIASGTVIIEQKFIHNGGKVAHIEDVIVHPNYRGSGAGKLLVEKLLEEAKKKGCYKTILNCDDKVVGFYEKLGFKKCSLQMRKD